MATFQLHPDRIIIIRDGLLEYIDTPSNFELDYGQSFDSTPDEIFYEPHQRHFINSNPAGLTWPRGDAIIQDLPRLITAQQVRFSAENPPPTQEELDRLELIDETIPREVRQWLVGNPGVKNLFVAPLVDSELIIMNWDMTTDAGRQKVLKAIVALLEVTRLLAYQNGLID